ncbi:hypothetical protein TIFTF001_001430 [Ficus carica]|uniref:Uncharacterized protein n=1 Tax=Ficus carica TaxID=3494 RepID=A0AA88CRM1_FICCA|nr:hypothetical protein TIFTF001_001430 [Ficus carica]
MLATTPRRPPPPTPMPPPPPPNPRPDLASKGIGLVCIGRGGEGGWSALGGGVMDWARGSEGGGFVGVGEGGSIGVGGDWLIGRGGVICRGRNE